MDINLKLFNKPELDAIMLHKMLFLYNTLENGWEIKKNKEKYIFTKSHEGKKEVYLDNYLRQFLEKNLNINKLK